MEKELHQKAAGAIRQGMRECCKPGEEVNKAPEPQAPAPAEPAQPAK